LKQPLRRYLQRNELHCQLKSGLSKAISIPKDTAELSASSVAAILDRLDQIAFKQALDEFEANLVEEVILTLPISRYFEPDDEGDLATVHTSIVSAHETLDEMDAVFIRLTDIAQGIRDGHI
jgi:hypothetical protein